MLPPDVCQVLRHATYRQERPWLALMGDLAHELRRPSRLLGIAFLLAFAAQAGVPVHRAVPPPVKAGYTSARAWQEENAAKLGCATSHSAAMRSGHPDRMTEAERLCDHLEATYAR